MKSNHTFQRPARPAIPPPAEIAKDRLNPERATKIWNNEHALFYAQTITQSDYAAQLAPLVPPSAASVLDIGAGNGALVRHCLKPGATWIAVEPNWEMQNQLIAMKKDLVRNRVALRLMPCQWQSLPPYLNADVVYAFNLGATHAEALAFHDAMRPRARKLMCWVVPAQAGPSTFCLSGFLPAELHGADTRPAFEKTLAMLGAKSAPTRLQFADWTYRVAFASVAAAQAHFLDRLGLTPDTDRGREVSTFVATHCVPDVGGVIAQCAKRSAVMTWEMTKTLRM